MTFAAKVKTLKEDEGILRQWTAGEHPHDFQMFGDLLKKGSGRNLDHSINTGPEERGEAKPDQANSRIQESPSKVQCCLVGEYEGRRGCIEIGESDKCLSGQVFPNQKMCLNPTLSQNQYP